MDWKLLIYAIIAIAIGAMCCAFISAAATPRPARLALVPACIRP